MKKFIRLTCTPSVLLALALSSAALAQEKQTEEQTNNSISDRHGAIADIVANWEAKRSFADGWEAEFTDALNEASDKQLLAIQDAQNYDQVGAILQGRVVPVALDGVAGAEAFGDLTSDLLYTPVVPCRFFDTRFDNLAGKGHTTGSTATTHSYKVWGSASTLVHQGYNKGVNSGAGCPSPKGEPVGIAANFTAAGPEGNGNIRAWPFGGTLPNVSLVNYTAGTNIANAGIIATGYLLSDDINVTMQYGTVDALGDVTGYFYAVDTNDPAFNEVDVANSFAFSVGALDYTNAVKMFGNYKTESVKSGYKVLINATNGLGTNASYVDDLDVWPCYHKSPYGGNPSLLSSGIFSIAMQGPSRIPISINGVTSNLSAGTYRFGMCYRTGNTNWNNNEWGYVSVLAVRD